MPNPNFNMLWMGAAAEEAVDVGAAMGARDAGEAVLRMAQQLVPLRTGMLRDTGQVDTHGDEATISYATEYAAILHEHPEWHFQNGREGKWLEDAMQRTHHEVTEAYGNGIRGKL